MRKSTLKPLWVTLITFLPALSLAQSCPNATQLHTSTTATSTTGLDTTLSAATAPIDNLQPINLSGDSWSTDLLGNIDISGQVQVNQGTRNLSADAVHYRADTQQLIATGTVRYEDTRMHISGTDADVSTTEGALFNDATFELRNGAARGAASSLHIAPTGEVLLKYVVYTSCPLTQQDWKLKASSIHIDPNNRSGSGRNVRLKFKGAPILYAPFLSFPVGNERKSGFLFPNIGNTSRGGTELIIPWYWNLAPNYDATLMPAWYSARGPALGTELRLLTANSKATATANYLPHDQVLNQYRALVQLQTRTDFNRSLRLEIDASEVSDTQWFEDFGQGRDSTSAIFLTRTLQLSYRHDDWLATAKLHNLQIIDTLNIAADERPYTLLPQISVQGEETLLPGGLNFRLSGDLTYFTRNNSDAISRLSIEPALHLPLYTHGLYVEPAIAWHYIGYQLKDPITQQNTTPHVSAPVYSLDTHLTFERLGGRRQQRLYTLAPRLLYTYIPYRQQDDLPILDTTVPDFNLVQLFRTDRFVGGDRLGDTNQLSVGITSQLFDTRTGEQFLSATIGQAFYFSRPQLQLSTTQPQAISPSSRTSDVIAQLTLSAYKHWSADMAVQWSSSEKRSERGHARIQYLSTKDSVTNIGYSFLRDELEQWNGSLAWPVTAQWSAYGKVVYSRLDNQTIDRFAGFEYRSCCWRLRFVMGRAISTRTGTSDTSVRLQLELNGLSSVGVAADTFLERSIPGYSARRD